MTKYALIQDGKVVELLDTDGDISEMFHESLEWVPAKSGVEVGDLCCEGKFSKVSQEPQTRQQVEEMRLREYSHPITGSDRFFAEAVRLQAANAPESDIEAAKASGMARYAEIQALYPWPEE